MRHIQHTVKTFITPAGKDEGEMIQEWQESYDPEHPLEALVTGQVQQLEAIYFMTKHKLSRERYDVHTVLFDASYDDIDD